MQKLLFTHYRSKTIYQLKSFAVSEETGEIKVVYSDNTDKLPYERPAHEFFGFVLVDNVWVRRFEPWLSSGEAVPEPLPGCVPEVALTYEFPPAILDTWIPNSNPLYQLP